MEVHHHPHVEKKSFKEYLLEGLMIFLAVTMGFIAENIRESIYKHEQEHQLMEEMAEDLQRDTASMNYYIASTQQKIYILDTLIDLVYQARSVQLPDSALRKMYRLYELSKAWGSHSPTTRALDQLDKERGFGFVRKKEISDSILKYKDLNQLSITLSDRFRSRQEDARIFAQNIFDNEFNKGDTFNATADSLLLRIRKIKLINKDFNTLSIYGSKLIDARIVLQTYLSRLNNKVQFAKRLTNNITLQYHLENK